MTQLEEWEEACNWVRTTNPYNLEDTKEHYVFYIKDNYLHYYNINTPTRVTKWYSIKTMPSTHLNSYPKVYRLTPFVGPIQPPPSPIIAKIRLMSKRRQEIGYAY